MITKYGYSTFAKVGALSLVLLVLAFALPLSLAMLSAGLGLFLIAFTLQFFRDPERTPPRIERVILSPADGKIVLIKDTEHPFFNGAAKLVSIFMSPINVHVNRNPISGKVVHLRHIEGEYIAAFDHQSGERNERTEIGIENAHIKVFFKQISGYVARRIICELEANDTVKIGERFGMIKFGSRVDVFMPPEVKLCVREGERVTAGETILAEY
ncbi:MAG: phosphatidylserine decarboxylase family protein [[Chlorobium] sp. 445]|nr:MAG: phosphatidylserine decarboxylase family protein [[Chlorobium] sp. 445]